MLSSKSTIHGIIIGLSISIFTGCDRQDVSTKVDQRLSDTELAQVPKSEEKNILRFGFDIRSSLEEDAKQYLPFLTYLEQATGFKFKLRFIPKDGKIVDELGKGLVHFAAIGATSYIKAADKYAVKPLVRGVNTQGKAVYRSYLVVRPDSPINDLSDLYGQRFAFGSRTSTQGHLIPRIILHQHKMQLQDFASYGYTGSHQLCAEAVMAKKYDVCGMQDTMAEDLARRQLVRILYRSDYFPSSGIAVNGDVPKDVAAKVKQALLVFEPNGRHGAGLYRWHKTEMPNGFIEARDSDYQRLREWMNRLKLSDNLQFSTQPGMVM